MDTIEVTDLYQASFYLANGLALESLKCIPVNGSLACCLTFTGEKIHSLSDAYFTHTATVNLFSFRQAYNQITSYIQQAKKSYKSEQRVGGDA